VSCAAFSIFCLVVSTCPTTDAEGSTAAAAAAPAYVGRFVTGLASAAPSVVVAGSVEDMFNARRRVWVVVLWNAGTTAGLCFGPVYAAYVSAAAGWRWVFRSAAAVTAVLLVALLWVRESRPSM
jgi:MFS family permease